MRQARIVVLATLVCLGILGCGDDSGGDGGDGGIDFAGAPSCSPGELAYSGLGYAGVTSVTGHGFINVLGEGSTGTLDVRGADQLRMEWEDALLHGSEVPARGSLLITGEPSIGYGNCGDGLEGGLSQNADGEGGLFLLRDLRELNAPGPDADYCDGTPVDGQIVGCWTFRPDQ